MTETEKTALLFKSRYETACVPVARDKTPLVKWGKYRDRLPEDGEIRVWFSGNNSIAVVAGKVQCIDFDEKYSAGIGMLQCGVARISSVFFHRRFSAKK